MPRPKLELCVALQALLEKAATREPALLESLGKALASSLGDLLGGLLVEREDGGLDWGVDLAAASSVVQARGERVHLQCVDLGHIYTQLG